MKFTRRRLGLGTLGLALAGLSTGAAHSLRRRFLFVHAEGGWDPLCVFAPLFDSPQIDMEPETAPLSIGNFSLVDSPGRPAARAFFEKWGSQTLLLNGISTRSVNHETCQAVALTGSTSDAGADWATMLAAAQEQSYYLPHLVLNGPSFPGAYNIVVNRAEGALQPTVHGDLLELTDVPLEQPSDGARALVDDYLATRVEQFGATNDLARAHQSAVNRSRALTDAKELIDFPAADSLATRASNAIGMLADGVTRCATLSTEFVWDTHTNNAEQTPLFQELFTELDVILATLASTKSAEGTLLSEDTVVVVLSEMARTPAFNATQGRDHWPYTSAMIIGPGIQGNRTIGAFNDVYAGIGVDPKTGDLDSNRVGIDAPMLGATLLALGDVDPGQFLKNPEVVEGVLT